MRNRIITLAATGLAAAALSLAGMAGASASSHPTKNATLVCGFNCFNLSNLQLDARAPARSSRTPSAAPPARP